MKGKFIIMKVKLKLNCEWAIWTLFLVELNKVLRYIGSIYPNNSSIKCKTCM